MDFGPQQYPSEGLDTASARRRILIEKKQDSSHVSISQNQYYPALFLIFCWIAPWTIGGIVVLVWLMNSDGSLLLNLILTFWLLGWAVGLMQALFAATWMLSGREHISITKEGFEHTLVVGPIKTRRNFFSSNIETLYEKPFYRTLNRASYWMGPRRRSSVIELVCRDQFFEFGYHLDHKEAQKVIAAINDALGISIQANAKTSKRGDFSAKNLVAHLRHFYSFRTLMIERIRRKSTSLLWARMKAADNSALQLSTNESHHP